MANQPPPRPKSALSDLEAQAQTIRKELAVPKQNEVFRAAVEAGYLTALADGTVDAAERATMVRAIEILSVGAVIEWETETVLDECAALATREGAAARTALVGAKLGALGQPWAGVFFATLVARASKGIDAKETEVLNAIAAAAGLTPAATAEIMKRASTLAPLGIAR